MIALSLCALGLLTYGCLIVGLLLLLLIATMWRAIWRDRRELDERDRREIEGFDE
jgi:hypothetical protein